MLVGGGDGASGGDYRRVDSWGRHDCEDDGCAQLSMGADCWPDDACHAPTCIGGACVVEPIDDCVMP